MMILVMVEAVGMVVYGSIWCAICNIPFVQSPFGINTREFITTISRVQTEYYLIGLVIMDLLEI